MGGQDVIQLESHASKEEQEEISKEIEYVSSIVQERLSLNGCGGFPVPKRGLSVLNFLSQIFSKD